MRRIGMFALVIGVFACGEPPPPVVPPPTSTIDAGRGVLSGDSTSGVRWRPRGGPSIESLLSVHRADSPRPSRDGSIVAFLSDAPGVPQPFTVRAGATQAEAKWTRLMPDDKERVHSVRFAPKDAFVFFTRDAGGDENLQILRAPAKPDGTIGAAVDLTAKPKVKHQLGAFSADGKLFAFTSTARDGKNFDVYVQNTQTGAPSRVADVEGSYTAEAFSPDGTRLAVLRERSSFDMDLFLLDPRATSKAEKPVQLTPHDGEARFEHAVFTKDGKALFVVSDLGREFMNVGVLDVATKKLEAVIEEPHDVDLLVAHGATLAISVNVDGFSEVRLYDATDPRKPKKTADVTLPKGVASDLALSEDGKWLVVALSGATFPNEVFRVEVATGKAERLTESDHAGVAESVLVEPTLERVKTDDGLEVPVLLFRPKDLAPGERAPVVVSVHGGPEMQALPMFNPIVQFLVGHGYIVAQPNVRGSTGYGKRYAHLDDKDKREDSIKDLATVNKWLRGRPEVDPDHIAVMGGSYGGYATLAAITLYPELWAAACDIVGIANFRTFLEKTAPYRRALREAEYGSLATDGALLDRISPIHKVEKVRSPLFVIHGTNDPRVPVEEAEQIVAALKKRQIRVEYMKFANEGHGLARRENRIAAYGALAKFYDEVLGK
jgi:dipeptidyl aminopeptidase/acylaminoacyl peptidase